MSMFCHRLTGKQDWAERLFDIYCIKLHYTVNYKIREMTLFTIPKSGFTKILAVWWVKLQSYMNNLSEK